MIKFEYVDVCGLEKQLIREAEPRNCKVPITIKTIPFTSFNGCVFIDFVTTNNRVSLTEDPVLVTNRQWKDTLL